MSHHSQANPLVSVIVVNYNGKAFLDRCLASLEAQTYPRVETIVVDNGSTDGSAEQAMEKHPNVRFILGEKNAGFAGGNNLGIRASHGTLIATLNNDAAAEPGWLEALAGAMVRERKVGMCASKMVYMADPGIINSTGICVSRSGASWDRGMFEPDRGQYDTMEEVFGPCAGAALYRKSMLDRVGLFDESFFAYVEDVDLAFRCRRKGWKCVYVPDAVVHHYHGGTAGYMSGLSVYYGNRNIVWNFVKNYPAATLLISLPWAIGRNLAILPYYALKGHGMAALRAKIDALKGLPEMLSKRSGGDGGVSRFIGKWANVPAPAEHVKPAGKGAAQTAMER